MIKRLDGPRHKCLNDNEVTEPRKSCEHRKNRTLADETDLMETPKHLIAIAASKNTAARGKVSSAMAKNDARR